MEAKHTPIEEWIKENRKMHWVAYYTACHELLTYLGLQGIENPKEWVEKVKESSAILPLMEGMINFLNDVKNEGKSFTSRITMLENENDSLDIVLWACPADVASNPIQRIMDLASERNNLQSEVTKLQEENNMLKEVLRSSSDTLVSISWDGVKPIKVELEEQIEKLQAENIKLRKCGLLKP